MAKFKCTGIRQGGAKCDGACYVTIEDNEVARPRGCVIRLTQLDHSCWVRQTEPPMNCRSCPHTRLVEGQESCWFHRIYICNYVSDFLTGHMNQISCLIKHKNYLEESE